MSAAVTAITVAAIGLALLMMGLPLLFHMQRYVITGGSMEPTIHRGAVIFDRVVPVSALRVGDIVTFMPPGHERQVTHRIIAIEGGEDGQQLFRTQGDANEDPDPWLVHLPATGQARYSFQVPNLGYGLVMLATPSVRMLVLAVPALLIGVSLLVGVFKDVLDERRRGRRGLVVEAGG
ncbi:MAG TPA: signal peptidase I [Thermoleophilia bacterium]|nr:signal peptidase I [Thermoleophilia bacterium]